MVSLQPMMKVLRRRAFLCEYRATAVRNEVTSVLQRAREREKEVNIEAMRDWP
jgi:hypothetical protein